MGNEQSVHYGSEKPEVEYPDWMKDVADDITIADVCIPGSHAAKASWNGGVAVNCHNWSLLEQYEAGIRFVDIGCQHRENSLLVYQSKVDQEASVATVIQETSVFLQNHPSESIVINLREDIDIGDMGNTRNITETIKELLAGFEDIFWKDGTVPKMKDIRGRIVMLYEFAGCESLPGLRYTTLDVVNHSQVQDLEPEHLEAKWNMVVKHLDKAKAAQGDGKVYVTYTTGQGDFAFPAAVAKWMNEKLLDYLGGSKSRLGIIAMDYSSSELIKKIIDSNF